MCFYLFPSLFVKGRDPPPPQALCLIRKEVVVLMPFLVVLESVLWRQYSPSSFLGTVFLPNRLQQHMVE